MENKSSDTQTNILNFLKKNQDKQFTANEIGNEIKSANQTNVSRHLRILRRAGWVYYKLIFKGRYIWVYQYKK